MKLTIGIDARTFYYSESVVRGIGHYSLYHLMNVVRLLPSARFILYTEILEYPDSLKSLLASPNILLRHVDDYNPSDIDLLHICDPMNDSPGFDSPVRIFRHKNTSVTFYDLIPYHYYFKDWPESARKTYLSRIQQMDRCNCHFLAISEFSRQDLINSFNIPEQRVTAIMAGINNTFECNLADIQISDVLKKYGITKPFFLHVGAHDSHKNFMDAFAAFVQLKKKTEDVQFVISGKLSGLLEANAKCIREYGFPDVIFTGFTERCELECLYRSATATLFLSSFEGFGFPVLEAMSNGCPVITTNVTSIPEVAGSAAILCIPNDVQAVTDAMSALYDNPDMQKKLREAGYRQSSRFSWEATAKKTIAVWEKLLESSPVHTKPVTEESHKLRVLFDISVLGLAFHDVSSRTGVFRVVEHVARGLAASPEIDLHFCSTQHLSEEAPNTVLYCQNYLAAHPELCTVPFHADGYPEVDIFHSPFHPLPSSVPAAVRFLTVYDLIAVLYPTLFQGRYNPVPQILASIKHGDHALCISQSTMNDLCRVTGIPPELAHVTTLAAEPAIFHPCTDSLRLQEVRQKYNIGAVPYILSLCTLEPRKNIDHVIRAFAHLVRKGLAGETRLVLSGTKGWDYDRIFNEIDNNPELHRRLVLTGYVPDEELSALYSGALAFIYMSLYEGFGLPPLEAMQCGVPVIASNTSSLPEVVGDAGIMLDPQDVEGLSRAMKELITNVYFNEELARRSAEQAARFKWDRCVEETTAAYRFALKSATKVANS